MGYLEYQNTRTGEYFDFIPEHWFEERLHDISELKTSNVNKKIKEGEGIVRLCNYVDVYYHSKIDSSIDFMKASASQNEIRRFKLDKCDVVITKDSEDSFDIGIPAFISEDISNLVCGYHLTIIKAHLGRLLGRYLYYALRSDCSQYQFTLASNGVTRFGLTQKGTKNVVICVPPTKEQQRIANFLDYKTQQIDQLIEKKKALIEKLDEQRIAIITQAVTKGLDKNAKMKPSGVDWLGEVPEHWEVLKLKHISKKIIDGAHFTPTYVNEGVPFLRVTDIVRSNGLDIDRNTIKFIPQEEHNQLIKRCKPEKGDLLYSKNGTIGVSRVVNWEWDFSVFVSLCLIKPEAGKIITKYLSSYLESKVTQNQISIGAKSNTVTNLHLDKIKEFTVCLPPKDEQVLIVNYLEVELKKLRDMLSINNQAIEYLTEYRSAIITAAVTGKINVQNIELTQPESYKAA